MQLDEQEKVLEKAIASINQQANVLKMCFDQGSQLDALHCCANMLRGMRTSDLSPKAYYELYMKASEVLNDIEAHLTDEFLHGRNIPHLYEMVQYVANILPRMYLLITVGVVYIKSGELPCKDILHDLVEMCRGVQHPLRGLFLRNFLLSSIRPNLLPDVDPKSSGDDTLVIDQPQTNTLNHGTVLDSINFILLNFAEMNKLWVRMQHQGHSRDRERREQERRDLRVLVGANLHRISQLEAVTASIYKEHILPSVLEQVIQCLDVIAQEYLMDVIIQAFPDEFHVLTLPLILHSCEYLQPAVRLKPIISSLMERLLRFMSTDSDDSEQRAMLAAEMQKTKIVEKTNSKEAVGKEEEEEEEAPLTFSAQLFNSMSIEIGGLLSKRADLYESAPSESRIGLPAEDVPGLFSPLVNMAICVHPDKSASFVNQVLLSVAAALEKLASERRIQGGSVLSRELLKLLYLPLYGPGSKPGSSDMLGCSAIFSNSGQQPIGSASLGELDKLSALLSLTGFHRLFNLLDLASQRRVACFLIGRTVEWEAASASDIESSTNARRICSEVELESFFSFASVLWSGEEEEEDEEDLAEEHCLLASSVHLVGERPREKNPEGSFLLLSKTRQQLMTGGTAVIRATFPSLVFEAIQLLPVFHELRIVDDATWETNVERVIQFCHQSATKLVTVSDPDTALKLFLNCAHIIDHIPIAKQVHYAYEFFSQAFTLFEQELSESRSQLSALSLIVSTLFEMQCLDVENFQVLRTQCTRAASHLLLRPDQSRAVAVSCQLFWSSRNSELPDGANIFRDANGLIACLEKSQNLADMCMDLDARAQLYTDLLNYHIKFKQLGCSLITETRIAELLVATEKLITQLDPVPNTLQQYLERTKQKLAGAPFKSPESPSTFFAAETESEQLFDEPDSML